MRDRNFVLLSFLFGLFVIGCDAAPLWVKPGATEADLEAAMNECAQRYVAARFGVRDPFIREDPMIKPVQRFGRGASNMAQDLCLEEQGWKYRE